MPEASSTSEDSGESAPPGKGVHKYNVVCVCGRLADFISFFKYPMKMK